MRFKHLRPIYARDLGIRMPGFRVRSLALNRHLPEALWVEEHSHRHLQFLLYLSGRGSQVVDGARHEIHAGSLFFLPPRVSHSFIEGTRGRPLCLALDLDFDRASRCEPVAVRLDHHALHRVRHALSRLSRWRAGSESPEPCEAAAVLEVLDLLLRGCGLLAPRPEAAGQSLLRRAERRLAAQDAYSLPVAELAGKIGYQPDYLNRQLKQQCGLTLGQLRDDRRLGEAKTLLRKGIAVAEIALRLGFDDPNYFSRWFRKQSGETPSRWRSL